ncbi:MAG: hypothetical protein IJM33_06035 [Bacteroidales bacterium]|nr:hypothetical protein [Bacteroidales bacterium]
MKNPILHNRFWLVVGILLLVECAALFAFRSCPRQLPERKCSEVYRRYAHAEGVEAAFVKDFPINDTVAVDVTLLRACDSAGWVYLMESFHISEEMVKESEENPQANIWVSQSIKGSPETKYIPSDSISPADSDIEIVAKAMKEREICIFHTRGAGDREAIQNYNWDVATKKRKHQIFK